MGGPHYSKYTIKEWKEHYSRLEDFGWDIDRIEEFDDPAPVLTHVLLYVYRRASSEVEGVYALLFRILDKECVTISPVDFSKWVKFAPVRYESEDVILADWMKDHYGDDIHLSHLNEAGRRHIRECAKSPNEVWVKGDDVCGTWVFTRP